MSDQPQPMLTVREALDFLLAPPRAGDRHRNRADAGANGRVLAAAQASTINVPSADNTQMDGYAVRAADCAGGDATLTGQPAHSRRPGRAAAAARHRGAHLHRRDDPGRAPTRW
jgi:molybdopterin molybdotransferase